MHIHLPAQQFHILLQQGIGQKDVPVPISSESNQLDIHEMANADGRQTVLERFDGKVLGSLRVLLNRFLIFLLSIILEKQSKYNKVVQSCLIQPCFRLHTHSNRVLHKQQQKEHTEPLHPITLANTTLSSHTDFHTCSPTYTPDLPSFPSSY